MEINFKVTYILRPKYENEPIRHYDIASLCPLLGSYQEQLSYFIEHKSDLSLIIDKYFVKKMENEHE